MYTLGDFVEMKKPHACVIKETGKKANRWESTIKGSVTYVTEPFRLF